jgi:N-carbamoyl-L-amino-acid hydrolase
MSPLDPKRTVRELKELRALTGNEDGAWRVAWTDTWLEARRFMREKTDALGLETHMDAAGNVWSTLAGESDVELLIGGHIDSVPGGGWLDGCLNVLAGLEVIRRIKEQYGGRPPVTVRLVDWADEEGARFGRSLLGSSAAGNTLVPDEERHRKDADGVLLVDALKRCGVDLDRMNEAHAELAKAGAYLELHIEQGPVLLDMDLPLGVVLGTYGVERHAFKFVGQAAHSGSTPMNRRRDAFLAAGKMSQEIYALTDALGGVSTIGSCVTRPGIVTSVVAECDITLDQRHLDRDALTRMYEWAVDASQRFAEEGGIEASTEAIWRIDPMPFHPDLLDMAEEAVKEATGGLSHRLPSGPLHDAAEVARAGIPTVMLFTQSLHGISHNKIEDTKEEHLEQSVVALDSLADKTIAWLLAGGGRQ